MASTQLRPGATWQSLGAGPFDVRVLTGTIVLQAADRCPASADISGTIVTASVGSSATRLDASEWWVKALVTETVMTIAAAAPDASGVATAAASVSTSVDGAGFAGVDLAAAVIVVVAADGTLRPASSSDPNQFGRVAGFTLLAVLQGGQTSISRRDSITDSAWTLVPGEPVFVGEIGGVTQVEPTVGFIQVAGLAVSATTIVADFGAPILL